MAIKFNPKKKDNLTYGEALGPAMEITDEKEAEQYLKDYIEWQSKRMTEATGENTPEEICKTNLVYYAGYYNTETMERVNRLFQTTHPVFGG